MRRRPALIMLGVAGAAVAVTTVAAITTVMRYSALRPLDHPFLTFFAASVVAVVAVRGLLPESDGRLWTQTGIGLLGLLVGGAGGALSQVRVTAHDPEVVATSGDVKVVAWRQDGVGRDTVLLRLRSRDWLLSRDGAADIGCFVAPRGRAGTLDAWTLASVTVSGDTVVARTVDGQQWRVRVDIASLRQAEPKIDRCTHAPGYSD